MNRPKFEKINDLYIDSKYQIFKSLYKLYSEVLPWRQHPVLKDLTPELLDVMYRYHSGLKTIHYPIAHDIEKYDSADYAAYYIYSTLSSNWKKDFDVLFSDFNFLNNVDLNIKKSEIGNDIITDDNKINEFYESENNDLKNIKDNIESVTLSSDKISSNTSENESETKNGESLSERFDSSVTDENIFTFNAPRKTVSGSNDYEETFELPTNDSQNSVVSDGRNSSHQNDNVNRDRNTLVENNNESVINNNNNINSNEVRTVNDKYNKNIDNIHSKDFMYQHDESDDRSGRDGRFTPQKMSAEQLEINKNIFFERVFNTIDKLITIPCY